MNTDNKTTKRNLIFYPIGTLGRDMIYALFTNFILLYIMYTRDLSNAQLGVATVIMVSGRILVAIFDPIMGNIIERTRSRFGKFKPWLAIGVLSTSIIVYLAFNTNLEGWSFIVFFGVVYYLYSFTFTMHDIAYWGMVPALSSESDMRDKYVARATLFAGLGNVAACVLTPLLTTGEYALGGSANVAYGRIALIICVLAPLFICFTLFGAKENRDDMNKEAPKVSFKKIIGTLTGNDQLMWILLIFLIQQIGNGIVTAGIGTNYIYFEFGYEGGLYSIFNTVGMAATAILMVFYPMISKRVHRKPLVKYMGILGVIGYVIMLGAGLIMPTGMPEFWVITVGFLIANFGQYGLNLVMMVSIVNTVEYNEYKHGVRDEAIISSMRPFLTKIASAFQVLITTVTYLILRVTDYTNEVSSIERDAEQGLVSADEKSSLIAGIISEVGQSQTSGLLITITVLPCALMLVSCVLYRRFYKLDEERYDEICEELNSRK